MTADSPALRLTRTIEQLKRVTDSLGSQPVIDYTYLQDGKVDHADYRNGVHCAYGYDGRGMIGSIQNTRGDGANLSSRTYWRDERDRVTAYQKSTNNSVNPMENGRGDRFRYEKSKRGQQLSSTAVPIREAYTIVLWQ